MKARYRERNGVLKRGNSTEPTRLIQKKKKKKKKEKKNEQKKEKKKKKHPTKKHQTTKKSYECKGGGRGGRGSVH